MSGGCCRSFVRNSANPSPDRVKPAVLRVAAVRFLAGVEAAGTEIVNCPEYLRIWIAAENDSQ